MLVLLSGSCSHAQEEEVAAVFVVYVLDDLTIALSLDVCKSWWCFLGGDVRGPSAVQLTMQSAFMNSFGVDQATVTQGYFIGPLTRPTLPLEPSIDSGWTD